MNKKYLSKLILATFIINCLFPNGVSAQTNSSNISNPANIIQITADDLRNLSDNIAVIARSVESLNARMKTFSDTFTSNQGLKLDEKQQKILFAFEILNRSEQRLVNLQTLKLTLTDKTTSLRLQLARNADNLLPESVDRYVATRGRLNAEQLREIRRQALYKEKNDILSLLSDSEISLRQTNEEIRVTELFLINIREKLFPQIEKELSDF